MLVSHELEVISFRIPKTANKAITRAIKSLTRNPDEVEQIMPETGPYWRRRKIPQRYHDYFVFAVVRNPYSRIVSHYLHRKQKRSSGKMHKLVKQWSFKEYLIWNREPSKEPVHQHDLPQMEYLREAPVDKIIRFESLPESFAGLPFVPEDYRLPYVNTAKETYDWRDYYTEETAALVLDWMMEDFDRLGYVRESWKSAGYPEHIGDKEEIILD